MILPAMGVVSEVFACFARRRVFGYAFMVFSLLTIGVIGFMVWGHHMFVAGQSPLANLVFSFLSFIVAVPSAIKVFNWTATLYRGQIGFEAPMIYALGFLGLFTIGGLTGLFLASVPIDIAATDTYFVVAHFHTIMVGGTVSAFMAGIHYWWPKMTGRLYNEFWAQFAAITMFLGFNVTFLPQFVMGWLGMPRRYHYYPDVFQIWHILSSGGAVILAVAYLMPLVYLGWSLVLRRTGAGQSVAGDRPGMADHVTAAEAELFATAAHRCRAVRLPRLRPRRGSGQRGTRAAAGWTDMSDLARALQEPWPDLRLQRQGVSLGMWIFLASEVLFFCGLFITYAVYRSFNAEAFRIAGAHTQIIYGSINTALLLTSSLTMTVALACRDRAAARLDAGLSRPDRRARARVPAVQRPGISRRPRQAPRARTRLSRCRRRRRKCSGGFIGS